MSRTCFPNVCAYVVTVDISKAKIKITFVSPYPTDPKKLPLPKKFYCNFPYKIFFFFIIIVNYTEAKISCFRRIH